MSNVVSHVLSVAAWVHEVAEKWRKKREFVCLKCIRRHPRKTSNGQALAIIVAFQGPLVGMSESVREEDFVRQLQLLFRLPSFSSSSERSFPPTSRPLPPVARSFPLAKAARGLSISTRRPRAIRRRPGPPKKGHTPARSTRARHHPRQSHQGSLLHPPAVIPIIGRLPLFT